MLVKQLTQVVYRTDYVSQFASLGQLQRKHAKHTASDMRAATDATTLRDFETLPWDVLVFWEH
eukprot:6083501-Amphidinium_carterae.1